MTGLPSETVDQLFPFGIRFDPNGSVLEIGTSLRKLLGEEPPSVLHELAEVRRPRRFDPAALKAGSSSMAQLRLMAKPIELRGQIISLDGGASFYFFGSPCIASSEAMIDLGLAAGDFAPHDQTPNQVILNSTVQRALDEARQLADELEGKSAELAREQALLARILTEIPAGIYWKDLDGRYLGCNRPFARSIGVDEPHRIIGLRDEDMDERVSAVTGDGLDSKVIEDGQRRLNVACVTTDLQGRPMYLNLSRVPLRNDDRQVIGLIGVIVDTTERKLMEEQLARAGRLESIGQLAAGVAHEINTPTQFIGDNLRFLGDSFADMTAALHLSAQLVANPPGSAEALGRLARSLADADIEFLNQEIPDAVEQSLVGVERVRSIVESMKEFSHPGSGEFAPVDLNHAIETAATVARNEWRYVAELETDFDADLPPVPCLGGEINQVLLNIIVNAAHAIGDRAGDAMTQGPTRGVIHVSTGVNGGCAEVRISDTGAGMPPDIIGRIFDPFFTTKEVGRGTGQGLSLSHNIVVNKHGGSIEVDSTVGAGTTFTIRLPLEQAGINP